MKKKALTLTEIMITLTVIGVLTAVLLPSAIHSTPDEKILKFKKAHKILYKVIGELVSSDKYYKDGDLGVKADGTELISSTTHTEYITYFCKTFADLLSTKKVNCNNTYYIKRSNILASNQLLSDIASGTTMETVTDETIQATKKTFDEACQKNYDMGEEIVTPDNIVYYQAGNGQFGAKNTDAKRYFSPPNLHPANFPDQKGYDAAYKIFCIDIDGIPSDAKQTDCVNECPFGYGIRADGKILPGERADEWTKKSIQQRE